MSTQCISSNCAAPLLSSKSRTRWPRTLSKKIAEWWTLRRQQRINRNAFSHLLHLDDDMLKDIGLTRGDVTWANHLPKSVDASVELEIIARRRGKHTL